MSPPLAWAPMYTLSPAGGDLRHRVPETYPTRTRRQAIGADPGGSRLAKAQVCRERRGARGGKAAGLVRVETTACLHRGVGRCLHCLDSAIAGRGNRAIGAKIHDFNVRLFQ